MAEVRYPIGSHRWFVFAVVAAQYFFVYFHRVAPSVIVPDLMRDFRADATSLGTMASMYFHLYALEQPLVGYLSDVMGPKRVVGIWGLGAALGSLIFASSMSLEWASVGRGLIGLGVGGVFVPAMKAFSQWFPKKEFSGLVGVFLAVGNFGALCATTPLAWAVECFGWRVTFFGLGLFMLVLSISVLTMVKEPQEEGSKPLEHNKGLHRGQRPLTDAFFSTRFWILFGIFFGVFGSYGTLQSLWATPFLMSALGKDRLQASFINMVLPVGLILGAPVLGTWADRLDKARGGLLLGLAWVQVGLWVVVISGAVADLWSACTVLLLFGFTAGGLATTFWGVVRAGTPMETLGMTTGLLNPAPFLGSGILQIVTGAFLDFMSSENQVYSEINYRKAFVICLAASFLPAFAATALRKKL